MTMVCKCSEIHSLPAYARLAKLVLATVSALFTSCAASQTAGSRIGRIETAPHLLQIFGGDVVEAGLVGLVPLPGSIGVEESRLESNNLLP